MKKPHGPGRSISGRGSRPLQVFKFGGTSVGSAEAVRIACEHVQRAAPRVAVVVSAMSGVTDLLLAAAEAAKQQQRQEVARVTEELRGRHRELVERLVPSRRARADAQAMLERSIGELTAICQSVAFLGELTPRTLDAVVARGERVLAEIFAAVLRERGVKAVYVDATLLIRTERRLGSLWPELSASRRATRQALVPLLAERKVVVTPGFIAAGPDGETVTLGRGGSDFSAAILARSLGAQSVTLYKEVDGLMTADPKSVPEARVVPELHYREAAELAYYGAKVLHPRTMFPLVEAKIPLYVKNTFNAAFSGTRISGDATPGGYPVKALSAVRGQALVSIEGNGMMGVPGVAARAFSALSAAGYSVVMISQASSESSICFVVPEGEAADSVRALERAFKVELDTGWIDRVRSERGVALIAVVGLGMRGTPGIAARTFAALSREGINILAIAQGSSELNITAALRQAEATRALGALHREFRLEKIRPLPDTRGRRTEIALFGFGQIGRALARQISSQERYFRHDLGLEMKLVALADRSGVQVAEAGLDAGAVASLSSAKAKGKKLVAGGKAGARGKNGPSSLAGTERELNTKLFRLPWSRPVLVDLTAADTAPLLLAALGHGFHVVVANKKPLAVPQAEFDGLFAAARARGLMLRYEATVGAGLPVLDTLSKLKEAGDKVRTVLGCFSGTLGYLMTQLEDGTPFSFAVRQAHALGYTEPDPREDLSGMDVGRKALILARTLGRRLDLGDVRIEPLFPPELSSDNRDLFLANLEALDAPFAARVLAAKKHKQVLRYVARIAKHSVSVALEAVPEASPMGRLRGTDNQVALYTDRYKTNPLVVTGPGAGADVTAAGVLNDLVAVAMAGQEGHGQ